MASWTQEQIAMLIDAYQGHPCLYAIKDKGYHNKLKRNQALSAVLSQRTYREAE